MHVCMCVCLCISNDGKYSSGPAGVRTYKCTQHSVYICMNLFISIYLYVVTIVAVYVCECVCVPVITASTAVVPLVFAAE